MIGKWECVFVDILNVLFIVSFCLVDGVVWINWVVDLFDVGFVVKVE